MHEWPVLLSSCDPASEQFGTNAKAMGALVDELREVIARTSLGGSEASRERHVSRGKLLPARARRRVARPGFAVPRALAAGRARHVRRRGPGGGHHHRHRPRRRPARAWSSPTTPRSRAAPTTRSRSRSTCAPRRSRSRTGCRASTSSTRAARSCLRRTRCSPTATTSAASSTTRPSCRRAASPRSRPCSGSCTAGGAYVPAMSDEAVIVRDQGTIFLGGPPLVKAATGEVVIGRGARRRLTSTATCPGVADHLAENDAHALAIVRDDRRHAAAARPGRAWAVVEPSSRRLSIPTQLDGVVPVDSRTPVRRARGDRPARRRQRSSASSRPTTAPTLVTGFAHIWGHPVGIIANNGVLFSESALKGAHFIELCDQRAHPAALPPEHHRLHGRARLRGGRASPSTGRRW